MKVEQAGDRCFVEEKQEDGADRSRVTNRSLTPDTLQYELILVSTSPQLAMVLT